MKKNLLKKHVKSIIAALCASAWSTSLQATAITKLTEATSKISTLVSGPLGKTVIIFGTLGGVGAAIMKSNMWAAIAIFIIGIMFSFHMDNIASVFAG